MSQLIQIPLDDNTEIYLETSDIFTENQTTVSEAASSPFLERVTPSRGIRMSSNLPKYKRTNKKSNLSNQHLGSKSVSSPNILKKGKNYLDNVLLQVKTFSSSIADAIKNISDEVEVEFSVRLTTDAGIIISSVSTESSITVRLKWSKNYSAPKTLQNS